MAPEHMSFLQIIVLALVQGITEYLPISSSGHSILVPALTGWPDQGELFDAVTNMGTVCATILFFWRDVVSLFNGLLDIVMRRTTPSSKLVINLIVATIPVIVFGVLLHATKLDQHLRSPLLIAINFIVFGIALYAADEYGLKVNRVSDITPRTALFYGLAQMLALMHGTSRSGVTITAGRFLGFARSDAARFSFLMSIPANLAGSAFKLLQAAKDHTPITSDMLICAVLTFFIGLGTVAFLMKLIRTQSFLPFVIYRVIFGGALLGLVYSGMAFGTVN
jgi:undecaprenyl-diphosphatase